MIGPQRAPARRGTEGTDRSAQGGQVIVLFAFSLLALLLVGGLVLDVARVYTLLRHERSVADAASLAGAQDLQDQAQQSAGNFTPQASDYERAECDAYDLLVRELGGSSAPPDDCTPTSAVLATTFDVASYSTTISGYQVTITTPYSGAVTVSPALAVKVAISRPNFALTFGSAACLLPGSNCSGGAPTWDPTVASVAGIYRAPQYALVTLQPPSPKCNPQGCTDANLLTDIVVSGSNTELNIQQGDVGTNTSAATNQTTSSTGNPACIALDPAYYVDHYDNLAVPGQTWTDCPTTSFPDRQIPNMIPDPGYPYPTLSFPIAQQYATQGNGAISCSGVLPTFGGNYVSLNSLTWTCYQPGEYQSQFSVNSNADGAYLEPGVYYFPAGMSIGGTLAGGVTGGSPGVDLVFPESNSSAGGTMSLNNAVNVVLNTDAVDATPTAVGPAPTPSGQPALVTPEGFPLTIEVIRDDACFVKGSSGGTTPQLCTTTHNQTVNLGGNGILTVGGVVYGPSDNMAIHSSSTQQIGVVGEVIAYTVTYTGGAKLTQKYPGGVQNNVLRLDTACTVGMPCP